MGEGGSIKWPLEAEGVLFICLQAVVSRQTAEYDRWTYMQSNEPTIVKLQAHWKGYLARKAYEERLHFMKEQLPAIIRIQVRDVISS